LSNPGVRVHFIGIGGVSMAQLAELLHKSGHFVSGSDMQDSQRVGDLEALGIEISTVHDGSLIGDAKVCVRSAAIRDDNAEVLQAKALGIPLYERAELLGAIMTAYEYSVCVAGTHGKTTTSSMLTHIATTADRSPTAFIGARTPTQPKGFCLGDSNLMITESCEYYNSFLHFHPKISLILNIEYDHQDFFSDLGAVLDAFRQFAKNTPEDGILLINGACPNCREALDGMKYKTFGLAESDNVQATNIMWDKGCASFDVTVDGRFYAHVALSVPGDFNMLNALGALGVAQMLGIPGQEAAVALQSFRSAERRMELKGRWNDAWLYDDYPHHPTAVELTLNAVREMGFNAVRVVFQPHLYSRTAQMLNEFAEALRLADSVIVADIYAAREPDEGIVSSAKLAALIPGARAVSDFGEIAEILRKEVQPNDLILTMGAGDAYQVGEMLVVNNV